MSVEVAVRRLHWGCGRSVASGWINADRVAREGVDIACDIRDGLPLASGTLDYAFSMHALQEVPLPDLVPVLEELRRVLRPGGVLRLCLPDLDKGIAAYQRGDASHFLVPDEDASSLGGKLVTHMLWYGHSRSLFTADFADELLRRAGFAGVEHVAAGVTASALPEIVELDDRAHESLFVEAFA
jgi:predicted SAM-dependent methyltransferase